LILEKSKLSGERKMLAVALTIGTLVSIMFFFVGGVIGWMAKEHFYQTSPVYTHPEMFDSNGNIIPDEILAVRFENDYDYDDEIEEDDN
jgi:hypothetical protein